MSASAATPWTWTSDPLGRRVAASSPPGEATTSAYNPDDTLAQKATRLSNTGGAPLVSQRRYTYDNLGRQLTADDTAMQPDGSTAVQRHTFGYDPTGHLNRYVDEQGSHGVSL